MDHPLLPLLVILILEIGPLPLLEVLIRCYYLQDHQLGDLKWKEGRLSSLIQMLETTMIIVIIIAMIIIVIIIAMIIIVMIVLMNIIILILHITS